MPERGENTETVEVPAIDPSITHTIASEDARPSSIDAPRWLSFIADRRHAISILLIVGVALYLVNLGGYPLYTKGEPREAVTVFNIVHGGGVILPQRAGIEVPSKPLLMHWLAALASFVAGGVNEFAVRLPSAALAIAGVIVCYLYVRRLFDDIVALLAALMMATTFQYLQAATGARVDMTLTFFMEVAFFEFILFAEGLTTRTTLMYVALALAVLTKGPIGLMLPALVAFIWIALERRWSLITQMNLIRGAIIVLAIAGSWYVAALIEGGPAFFRKQILSENLLRLAGGQDFHEGHIHRFYYTELALLAGFMPWTILLPIVAIQATWQPRAVDSRLRYMMVWFAAVLVFYNIPQSKRGVYLLCMYPAFATLIALYLRDAIAHRELSERWVRRLTRASGAAFVTIGTAALISLAMLIARPDALDSILHPMQIRATGFNAALIAAIREHWLAAAILPVALELTGVFLLRTRARIERLVVAGAAGMVFIAMAVNIVVVPAIANTLSLANFTDHAMKAIDGRRAGYLGAINYGIAFYSQRTIPIVSLKEPNLPEYLFTWRANYDILSRAQRSRFDVVMISNPTSLDGSDRMMLLHLREPGAAPPPNPDYIDPKNLIPARYLRQ
ncbi:MAG: glycosyltransferase family 39 protein [Candidatus Binatus sp.]|uniref:ArnT family glycosyltransferase n=1 Tax=Candidatus Binatus sp. TaxID=2811406 RepID=UPI0027264470|nr:glycosyltransferase family 39 protein [Candidatus Binatus sp.]MDO8432950.1 glycosyltransferase family 39 protein [Candidatus Binatus sp.]